MYKELYLHVVCGNYRASPLAGYGLGSGPAAVCCTICLTDKRPFIALYATVTTRLCSLMFSTTGSYGIFDFWYLMLVMTCTTQTVWRFRLLRQFC